MARHKQMCIFAFFCALFVVISIWNVSVAGQFHGSPDPQPGDAHQDTVSLLCSPFEFLNLVENELLLAFYPHLCDDAIFRSKAKITVR